LARCRERNCGSWVAEAIEEDNAALLRTISLLKSERGEIAMQSWYVPSRAVMGAVCGAEPERHADTARGARKEAMVPTTSSHWSQSIVAMLLAGMRDGAEQQIQRNAASMPHIHQP
jgi:hypothetical protein